MRWRRRQKRSGFAIALTCVLLVGVLPALPRLPGMPAQIALGIVGTTTRISVSSSGGEGNAASRGSSIAPDGQIAAFWSTASNLVAGDTNGVADVFVYDITSGATTRVSVGQSGAEANGASISPSLSGDGRYVVFQSAATNLVATDTNGRQDIFLFDRQTSTTELISVTTAGVQSEGDSFAGDVTPDGRYVAFWSAGTLDPDIGAGPVQVFVRDRQLGTTRAASVSPDGFGAGSTVSSPSISDDGRFVAFSTSASNLVPNDTNGLSDVFVRDMVNGTTVRVSVGAAGVQGNGTSTRSAISGDGRSVAFESSATNLVDGDTNGVVDMFVYDTFAATTVRVSVSSSGTQGDGSSIARDHDSSSRFISRDGRYVVLRSFATNFGGPSGALYVRDTQAGTTTVISVATEGNQDTGLNGAVSSGGRYVVFESDSAVLVPSDTNAARDAFLRDTQGMADDFGSSLGFAMGADPSAAFSKDPVNLATGNFVVHADDLVLPGRLLPFTFTRWYNSADTNTGALGPGWTHSYNWSVLDTGSTVEVRRGDGRRDTFTRNPDLTYSAPPNAFDTLVKNGDGTYTDTLTSQVKFEFSAAGQLTRIHEPAGNQIVLAYSGANLTTITDTVSRQIALTYDGSNRLTQVQDPLGRKVTYGYDAGGRLSTVTDKIGNAPGQDPALHRWTYGYDGATRHITTITDPDGRVRVTNTYDSQGRVFQQRDALSALTQISYSAGQTVVTDPRLHGTTYTFDSRMRVLSQVDTVGANTYTITYVYDASGNRTAVTDRNGKTTDFTYDTRGNVLTKTDPEIDPQTPRYVTALTYDTKNNLTLVTDAGGFDTSLTYEPLSNVLLSVGREIDATTSAVTKYEYTDASNPGLPTKVIAPRGNTGPTPNYTFATTLTYDAQGNLVQRIDPDGAKTTFAYDSTGRLVSFVDPDGYASSANPLEHTWTVGYDENDRETNRTDPLGNVLRYGYDGAGNRTTLTDRRGNVTTYTYDPNTRLATVQQKPDPVGQPTLVYTTQVARDGNGNATRITQANGVVTDYVFDALDRLTAVKTYPDAQTTLTTSYVLDGNGQPTSRTTGDDVTVSYSYDALSRLTTVSGPSLSISYAYDPASQRTQMVDGTGTTTYQYDGRGRVTQVAAPNGTLTYAYDLDGNRTTLAYPGSQNVTYAYSPGGRLSTVTDWASRLSTYTYKPSGLVSTLSYPNTMLASYTYDRAQRLTQITNAVGATTITQHAYTLDAEGNRTALDEYVQGITQPVQTWSPSVQVNDVTTGQQDRPDIALGADGATYLIWEDLRTGAADVFFSRRDPATGTWSANQKVTDDTSSIHWNPAIALDGNNNAYAVWSDRRTGTIKNPDTDIFFSKRSGASGVWSANVQVNDDTNGRAVQGSARVAVKSAGDAVAVWEDHRSNQWNVYSSRLAAGGSTWGPNLRVTDNTVSRKFTPDVAVGSDGTAYAVWEDDRSGNADIYFSTLPAGSSTWTTNVKISDDPGTAAQYDPQIGISATGDLLAIWQDDRVPNTEVRMRRRLAGQTEWQPSIVASDVAAIPVSLALGVRSDGNAFAAWQDARGSSYDIWGADYTFATNSWSAATLVSDDPASNAQMRPAAALSTTELALAWRDDRVTGGDIRARRRVNSPGTDRFTYAFDGLNRLTAVTGPVAETFVLDGATNIVSRTGPTESHSYDGANRLISDGSQSYAWSDADRLVQRGLDTFTYDPLGRLVGTNVGGQSIDYAYNGDGLLSSITPTVPASPFLWDVSQSPSVLVGANSDRVVHGLGALYVVRTDGTISAFASDALGSVRAETSQTGLSTKAFRYSAYGTLTTSFGGAPTLLGYTGEYRSSIDVIYLRARWYLPSVGRFLSADPMAGTAVVPASLNAYGYAHAAPTTFTDPTGNLPIVIVAALANPFVRGAIVGAVGYTVGYLASRAVSPTPKDFDFKGLLLATAAGAATGGFGTAAPVGARVALGSGVSGAVEIATQLADGEVDPDRLLASMAFGGYGGLFRARLFPAIIGFNVLLSIDKRLARDLINRQPASPPIAPTAPQSEPPAAPEPAK